MLGVSCSDLLSANVVRLKDNNMGKFDEIRCKYPLPVAGANEMLFQTKDTDAQYLDQYEIREDGTLWHELYETEDHSERAKWEAANPGKEPPEDLTGMSAFIGCMTRVNKRWEQIKDITGEICFYASIGEDHDGWIKFSACFENGKVVHINLVEHRLPKTVDTVKL